jgi:hypothetical protein
MHDLSPLGYTPDGAAIFGRDDQLLVKFYTHAELSQFKSMKEGAPIHDDVVMIEVIQPGEKEPVRVLADDFHKRRFPKQWEAFKAGQEQLESGTPLNLLFPGAPSTILQLKQFNVFTVQQLAGLSDSAMSNIPMGRTLADKARAYLASATSGKNFHAVQDAMQRQIDEMRALLMEKGITPPDAAPLNVTPEEPQPEAIRRGPGRPRKEQAAA